MTNTVLLNNVDHHDLRVITGHSAAFGDNINQVQVLPTEFEDVQREYPIFLMKDANGEYLAIALLGLDKQENLFLDEKGWQARYIPALQQRGPFFIGFHEQAAEGGVRREPMIYVDLDHPRISRTEGQPLFLPQGGNSPYLEAAAHTLRVIHRGVESGKAVFAAFDQMGLIEPVAVEIKLNDREQFTLPNYFTIAADKLAALDGARLEQLNKSGLLRLAYALVSSLPNVNRLIAAKNQRRAAG
ncbi:MAG: SapC family protein [Pseudomonadota bacterium]